MIGFLFFHLFVANRSALCSEVNIKTQEKKYVPSAVYISIPSPLKYISLPFYPKLSLKKKKMKSTNHNLFFPLMANSTIYCVLLLAAERHNLLTKSPHNRAVFEEKPFYIQPISLISPPHNGPN